MPMAAGSVTIGIIFEGTGNLYFHFKKELTRGRHSHRILL